MFTITNKLRAIVALGAVTATVASSAVASAATAAHPLGGVPVLQKLPGRLPPPPPPPPPPPSP